jgi:S-adenosyl-L-methionine hydrolase (adenosine-forming)
MKGVLLSMGPLDLQLIDISHMIPANDIMAASWTLREAVRSFPDDTIHLVVVDPGVGTDRDAVIVRWNRQWFVGPDNGLFSLMTEQDGVESWKLNQPSYWKEPVSKTFHGRDIFAPIAAHLANGVSPEKMGAPGHELLTWRWVEPILDHDGIRGWVAHIDRFGNLISNIPASWMDGREQGSFKIYVGNTIIDALHPTFGAVEAGDEVAYIGSSGMLEVAVNQGHAGELLGVPKGSQLTVVFQHT